VQLAKTIIYNHSIKVTVAGIVKDINQSTDFNFKEFISYNTIIVPGTRTFLNIAKNY